MSQSIRKLLDVMHRLRNPENGCLWDLEQNFRSIAPHTLEEAYEVVEAIENDDAKALCEELGDLLFQVVFHAQMASEKGLFDFDQVASRVTDKMVERHPHVFGDRKADTAHDVLKNWEADKEAKRAKKAVAENRALSALDGVNSALPAPTHALKLQERAARVGFDWIDVKDIVAKVHEELAEFEAEIGKENNKDAMEDELGDVFFVLINLARRLKIDPETALRRTNRKFIRRFQGVESYFAAKGSCLAKARPGEMNAAWDEVKSMEKKKK